MLKKLLTVALTTVLALFTAVAFAVVDVNKATQAEIESVKGIGPAISTRILDERKKSEFKDWTDLVGRVKGIGAGSAAKLSGAGLTVNGAVFAGAGAASASVKPAPKAPAAAPGAVTKAASAAPATPATPAAASAAKK